LKAALVSTPIIVKLDFTRAFILDVDWSICGVGAILSKKDGRNERIIAYVSKGLSFVQKNSALWRVSVVCRYWANAFQTIFVLESFYTSD
jgi:hypothetical protein